MSSQALPPWMSLSACSALAFASAFWASDGPMAPVSFVGATSMTQACRCLRRGRLDGEAGVDILRRDRHALLGGELRLELRVDQPLERDRRQLLALLIDGLLLASALRLGHVAGHDLGRGPPDGLVEAPATRPAGGR